MLITDLAQTPGLDVVSSERIQKILKQIGQEDLEHIDKSLVDEVARRAGAGAVVVGSIFKSGSDVRIDVQVQDVSSGRILSADSVQGQDIFPLVDELTGRIRSSLQMGDSPADRPLADVTTPSLEAFQFFSDGLDARRNLRWEDARQFFEQAVVNDPSFAMAYAELVRVAQALGEPQLVEQYREKVLENIDRLPERQRLLVEARDAHRYEGDQRKAIDLFEALLAQYPDEADAYPELLRLQSNQTDQLAVAERGVEAVPSSGQLRNDYAYQLLFAGRYAEAVRQFETYVELSPGEPNPQDSLAEAYLFTGQPEKAVEMYGQALQIDPSFGPSHAGRSWAFSAMGRYDEALTERERLRQMEKPSFSPGTLLFGDAFILSRLGRYEEAGGAIAEAQELDEDEGLRVALLLLSALTSHERGRYGEAVETVREAQALLAEVTLPLQRRYFSFMAPYLAGVAEARRGNLDAARAQLDAQAETYEPGAEPQRWLHGSLRGEIALAAGELAEAEAAFSGGEPQFKMVFSAGAPTVFLFVNQTPSRDGLGRVMKARGDLAGAIRFYRALLTPDMSSKWTAMLEPRLVLELARLLDASDDKESARTEYQRFLALWKNADEGLQELQEAREYLAN
ncbi:MAG TPA: tetratricopeptide repeat protein, partial [Vicinamibacteria bacterium]